jgi:putative hemolysin
MNTSVKLLLLLILCLIIQSFFSMLEMASVSFNKVRLQYYVAQNSRRAKWLSYLLDHPARLFGTTLIGVNAMLQLGSELARQFYISIGVSPDWAAISQTILVLIFAELSPMFAARRYSEHVAMLGSPILFFFSILMTPFIWCFNLLCRLVQMFTGKSDQGFNYLTREELQKAIEEREEEEEGSEFDEVAQNILLLKQKQVKEIMLPLNKIPMATSEILIEELRLSFAKSHATFVPVYHVSRANIVGVAYAKQMIRAASDEKVRCLMSQPWFISESSLVADVLSQFRHLGQHVAIVLDQSGNSTGVICLDDIIRDLFGAKADKFSSVEVLPVMIERTFLSGAKIVDINRKLGIAIEDHGCETLEDLMIVKLGHRPNKGESVRVGSYDLTMLEAGLLRGKRIEICSK